MLHTGPMDELKGPKIVSISAVIRDNLKELREEKDWSQRQVAEILTERTGETWTQTRVLDMEGGRGRKRTISPDELVVLARLYGKHLKELFRVPDDALARVGRSLVASEDLIHLLGIDQDTDSHFNWQWAHFQGATLGLFWRGKITKDLLDQAAEGIEVHDDETGEVVWKGPAPEESQQAQQQIRDAYREVIDPEIIREIAEDLTFWGRVKIRRSGWGVRYAEDDFTNLVLSILRDDKKGKSG